MQCGTSPLLQKIIIGVGVVTALAGVTASISLHDATLVEWWKPVAVSVVAAVVFTGLFSALRKGEVLSVDSAMMLVWSGCVFCGLFYVSNYCFSDPDSRRVEDVTVVRRFKEERYRTRRLNRHTTVRGEKYYVERVEIAFGDGRRKSVRVSPSRYSRIRTGSLLRVNVEKGAFGVDVMKGGAEALQPVTPARRAR